MNSAIALGVNNLQVPDQAAGYQRALTMAALLGQHDLQGLQVQEAQRTLRQNQAMDEAAQGSTSMEDYLSKLSKVNPGAAIKLQSSLLDTQKTRGEVSKQQSEAAAQLAGSVTSAAEQDRPVVYKNMVAEWARMGLPTANPLPPDYSPEFLPHLSAIAARGLHPKEAMERSETSAASMQPTGMPTTMAQYIAPQPTNIADMNASQENAAFDRANNAPTVDVTAKKPAGLSPDEMRARGDFAASKGTPAGNKVATDWYNRANQVEERLQAEEKMRMDKYSAAPSAPGVSFNKTTGQYTLNGQPISAEEVQKIANQQAKSGATVVTQNAGPKAFYGKFGDNMAEQLGKEQASAQKAADTVTTINKMRAEMDSGMYTGGFAERRLGVVNMLNGLGIPVDEKKLANTQAFKSFVGSQLLQHAKDLGTNPSNADAVRIDKIIGNIENDPNALVKIMDFNEEMGRRAVDRFNRHYQEVKKDPNAQFGFDMSVQQPEKYKPKDIQVRPTKPEAIKGSALPPTTNAKGWVLHTDAQGRQAYVSPDGFQYEEVR